MKKATVFSFFHSANIGDLLIAEMSVEIFKGRYDCLFCDITSGEQVDVEKWLEYRFKRAKGTLESHGVFSQVKRLLLKNSFIRDTVSYCKAKKSKVPYIMTENCRNSDLAVFFGGNSVMSLGHRYSSVLVLRRAVSMIEESGKKVAFCAAGVGPFKNEASRVDAKNIFELADCVSVRDEASYKLVKSFVPEKDVFVVCDPVLTKDVAVKQNIDERAIGINVYFGADKRKCRAMKRAFISAVSYLRRRYPEYKVYLFSSEMTDICDIKAVKEHFEKDVNVCVKTINSAKELFELYETVDLVVGTRMHTIITSLISHRPVLSISWQEKVLSLSETFENLEWNIKADDFMSYAAVFAEKLDSLIKNRERVVKKNDAKLLSIKANYKDKILEPLERI